MPTISITDQLGVEINVALNDDSALAKYIKDLKKLKLSELKFTPLENTPLNQAPLKSLTTGVAIEQPVGVGIDKTEMKIGAGVSGNINLLSAKDKQLFDPDVFADPIAIGADQIYLAMGISAKLSAELATKTGDLGFGFGAGTQIVLSTYRLFEKSAAGVYPNCLEALKQTVAGFVIPGDLEDLAKIANGAVTTVEGTC